MKYLLGLGLAGLVAMGMTWVWASEQSEQAIQQQKAAERAADHIAAQAEQERIERQHRERELAARRELKLEIARNEIKLSRLHKEKEKLVAEHGENHPVVREIQVQIQNLTETFEKQRRHLEAQIFQTAKRDELPKKIEHLHAAAEHLHQAGMVELARELHERAQSMERELDQQHTKPNPETDHRFDEVVGMVNLLRRDIKKLQGEVAELRKELQEVKR